VVNTLLAELDGLDGRKNVYVIAATNRPDMIDPAMCRPGRLDKLLYVDLPSPGERVEILRTMLKKVPLDDQSPVQNNVEEMVRNMRDGHSGADLAAVVREAGIVALKRTLGDSMDYGEVNVTITIGTDDFVRAFDKIAPSVSVAQRKKYLGLKNKFAGIPTNLKSVDNEQ